MTPVVVTRQGVKRPTVCHSLSCSLPDNNFSSWLMANMLYFMALDAKAIIEDDEPC